MMTELGNVTHEYWWNDGCYYRRPLAGGATEAWTGKTWQTMLLILRKAA